MISEQIFERVSLISRNKRSAGEMKTIWNKTVAGILTTFQFSSKHLNNKCEACLGQNISDNTKLIKYI